MRKPSRGLIAYVALIAAFILLATLLGGGGNANGSEITYDVLLEQIAAGKVNYLAIRNRTAYGLYYESLRPYSEFPAHYDFSCYVSEDFTDTLYTMVSNATGTEKAAVSEDNLIFADQPLHIFYLAPLSTPWFLEWLPFILITVLVMAFWWFTMRQQMGGGQRPGDELWQEPRHPERPQQEQDPFF